MGKRNNVNCGRFHASRNSRKQTFRSKSNSVKVRIFWGATIDDIEDFLKPYLKRSPTNIILHVGTNNSINDSSSVILNKLLSLKNFIHTELPESNVILSNIIDGSDNGIARLNMSNFSNHLNSLKIDTIDNSNITSEHLNDSGLHLNMKLIKKHRELRRRKVNRNWQQSGQSLARPKYYVLNSGCNNGCKRKSYRAGPKHTLEIKHTSSPADFQDAGNQMNLFHEIRIKNPNRLIIGHLNVNSLRYNFEMLE